MSDEESEKIGPQPGPQEAALASDVDILGYGGSAFGGKTWFLLADPIRYVNVKGFGAVYFRREATQLTNEGGLWDESGKIYPHLKATPRTSPTHTWVFPSGVKFTFGHLFREDDKYSHQGGQYAWIGFDEATHFTEGQVWYLIGRNRSDCGIRKVRMTFNPDGTSWVKRMYAPWVDDTYPDRAACGEVRWLVRVAPDYHYFRRKAEGVAFAKEQFRLPDEQAVHAVRSVTFIEADIYDNVIGMERNPGYLADLLSQDTVNRQRLLYKDWNIVTDRFFGAWKPKTADGKPWHVVPTGKCPKNLRYYLCSDYGFAAPFASYLVGFDHDARALVCRELYAEGQKASQQALAMVDLILDNEISRPIELYAGFDIFAARAGAEGPLEPIRDIYERVFREQQVRVEIIEAGRDPITRAAQTREYLDDWGATEAWPDGQPGLQVMECCPNLIRTLPMLKSDAKRPEQVDTMMEDHGFDALGHVLTSRPRRAEKPDKREELGPRVIPLEREKPERSIWDVVDA